MTLEQSEESSLIHLEGAIDIACAAELKRLVLTAIESGRGVCVSLEAATYLDVTAIQLLWAARRAAKTAGVEFSFAGEAPEAVLSALVNAGFERFSVAV